MVLVGRPKRVRKTAPAHRAGLNQSKAMQTSSREKGVGSFGIGSYSALHRNQRGPLRRRRRRRPHPAQPVGHLDVRRDHVERRQRRLYRLLPGQVAAWTATFFAFFVITVAAAEVAIALGLIVLIFRRRDRVDADDLNLLKGSPRRVSRLCASDHAPVASGRSAHRGGGAQQVQPQRSGRHRHRLGGVSFAAALAALLALRSLPEGEALRHRLIDWGSWAASRSLWGCWAMRSPFGGCWWSPASGS